MVQEAEIRVTRVRGGNRHPMSSLDFIITWLSIVGEDYIASMHRAYKRALDQLAIERRRRYAYHKPVYHSFEMQVQRLARDGVIEFSGREEPSDEPRFENWDNPPMRRYYRLARSPAELPTLPIQLDGDRAGWVLDGHKVDGHAKMNGHKATTNGR